jgi:hypothetical protein
MKKTGETRLVQKLCHKVEKISQDQERIDE